MPSTARTAPTWRWKMIPCVSGKCILRAFTSRRFLPLSNVAVERLRWMNWSSCTVMAISLRARRRLARRFDALHLGRQVRDFHLDRLERLQVPDVPAPVGVREPAALLRPEAARLVVGLRVRDVPELRDLLRADLAPVLAARLEAAAGWRRDEVRRQAFDRQQLRLARLVKARDRPEEAPRVRHLRIR